MTELKPCPFCGGEPKHNKLCGSIRCKGCGAYHGMFIDGEEIRAWNARAHDIDVGRKDKRIAELEEALENAYEGLMYGVHLVNNYEHYREGSKISASSTFGIIKSRYKEIEQALKKEM